MVKKQLGPTNIFFPIPPALIVSGKGDDSNIITIAWIGIAASNPPIISISVNKNRFSLDLIRSHGEFSVNLPSSKYFKETDYCGIISGKDTDKFEDTGFTPIEGIEIDVPIIKECPYNIECRTVKEVELGNYIVFFGEILETHVDSDKFDRFTDEINIKKVDPLVYCAVVREYWSMGNMLGKGFEAGRDLFENK